MAGIAFATQCCMTAASNFMQGRNASEFNRSLGPTTRDELLKLDAGITIQGVLHYLNLPLPDEIRRVLNLDTPGSGDQLHYFPAEVAKQGGGSAVAFQRRGALGFDVVAVPLMTETIASVRDARTQFKW
jgi:hypothetical protein